jgi:hypothetical protein
MFPLIGGKLPDYPSKPNLSALEGTPTVVGGAPQRSELTHFGPDCRYLSVPISDEQQIISSRTR